MRRFRALIAAALITGSVVGASAAVAQSAPAATSPALAAAIGSGLPDRSASGHVHDTALVARDGHRLAESADVTSHDSHGRQLVEVAGPDVAALGRAVAAAGGAVLVHHRDSVLADVAPDRLAGLSAAPGVTGVSSPRRLAAESPTEQLRNGVRDALPDTTIMSEGVASTGAAAWQTAGQTGTGTKVAIIAFGFANYAGLVGNELPANTVTINHCGTGMTGFDGSGPNGDFPPNALGTATAEVVHDMAPGAQLYLICVFEDADVMVAATSDLPAAGIKIAAVAVADPVEGRGDGSGIPGGVDDAVAYARQHGQLWATDAGPYAAEHFGFTASDRDNDGAYEMFSGSTSSQFIDASEQYSFTLSNNQSFFNAVKWDAWPTATRDVSPCYWFDSVQPANFLGCASQDQTQSPGPPFDLVSFTNTTGATRKFVVVMSHDAGAPTTERVDMWFLGQEQNFSALNTAQTITAPGDSPFAFTAGATCYSSNAVEPFSGRGPTIDTRIKPDIAAPDGVSTAAFGSASCSSTSSTGFQGTAAAAAHVAGAAALFAGSNPSLDAAGIELNLEQRANGGGPYAKSTDIGAGYLKLGAVPPPAPTVATPRLLHPLTVPTRVLDTRDTTGGHKGALATGQTLAFTFASSDVPADATAVVLNVTAVSHGGPGFLTVYPHGGARPNASSVNFPAGGIVPNHVTAAVGLNGGLAGVDIYNFAGPTDVVVDLAGYYGPSGTEPFATLPVPVRAIDTRYGTPYSTRTTALAPGTKLPFVISGSGRPVPAGATGVMLNVTVTNPTGGGFLSVVPSGATSPVSNLNYVAGQTVANLVVSKTDGSGSIDVVNSIQAKVDVIVDVVGWYGAGGTDGYVALPPVRDLDSRYGNGPRLGPLGNVFTYTLTAGNVYGVPSTAHAVQLDVVATEPTAPGFFTVWPAGATKPNVSNLNFVPGQTVANAVVSRLGTNGGVNINNFQGNTHVVSDLEGYFATMPT